MKKYTNHLSIMNIQKDLRRGFLDRMWAGTGHHGVWKHENTVWADGSDLVSRNRETSRGEQTDQELRLDARLQTASSTGRTFRRGRESNSRSLQVIL